VRSSQAVESVRKHAITDINQESCALPGCWRRRSIAAPNGYAAGGFVAAFLAQPVMASAAVNATASFAARRPWATCMILLP